MRWAAEEMEYDRLRSRMYNLFYNRKRLARQVRRLLQDIRQAEPECRALAIRDGLELKLHKMSREQIDYYTHHCPRTTDRIREALAEIFQAKHSNSAIT